MAQGVTIALIAEAVADVWEVSVANLRGPRRFPIFVDPRHVAFALAREHTAHSLPTIGQWFGDRDHTTVLNGIRRFDRVLRDRDHDRVAQVERLIDQRRRATFVRGSVMTFQSVRGAA